MNLINNSTVLTNSEFSRRAIANAFGVNDIRVLSPPVDTERFRNILTSNIDNKRKDMVLVVSRIDPYKQIENAIKLGKILKEKNIGTGMKIVGTLYNHYIKYYKYLKQMVIDLNLGRYISFEINASLNKLFSIMREAKVYFHPMREEPFGISVVEAMAAGLFPIVPDVGGPTEFVPRNFHFNSLEKAADIVSSALDRPYEERIRISNSVEKFSTSNYILGFQSIVNELLY